MYFFYYLILFFYGYYSNGITFGLNQFLNFENNNLSTSYIAIVYPLFSQRYSRSFGPITILIIWLFGIILGLFQWTNTEARPFLIANETNYDCKEISNNQSKFFTIFLFIITFALPIAILIFTYGSITVKIFHHSTPGNADVARDRHQHSSKKKVFFSFRLELFLLFLLNWNIFFRFRSSKCWSPFVYCLLSVGYHCIFSVSELPV